MRVLGYSDAGPGAVVSGGMSDEMGSSVGRCVWPFGERTGSTEPAGFDRERAFGSGGFHSSWTAVL